MSALPLTAHYLLARPPGVARMLRPLAPDASRAPAELSIRTLGGFRVLRRGVEVRAGEWQSKKARDLLKLLVARRGRPATRDALIEALWPDEDPERTASRLSVTLSTLRRVLDPHHSFPPDRYLRASLETVALERGSVLVDLEHFLAESEAGLAAVRRGAATEALPLLEHAERAYTGDFLEEDLYEDWAAGPREEARAVYLTVVRALARLAASRGDHGASSRHTLRILELDPYDEDAHLALVNARLATRAHGEARRAYGRYVARMHVIGVEPAPLPQL